MTPQEELAFVGRTWLRGALTPNEISELAELTEAGTKPGVRMTMSNELDRLIGRQSSMASELRVFGVDTTPVRLVSFNKSERANWSVPWHQDRVIAVSQKIDIEGYSNWTPKAEYWHCEPPESVMNGIIFIRIHIDANSDENGPMEIALGSHRKGKIPSQDTGEVASSCEIEVCKANSGDVLVVHALTLHRSKTAQIPCTRRALRADYARRDLLIPKLQWALSD